MTERAADPTGRRHLLVRSLMARRGQSDRLMMHAAERSEAADEASESERGERHGDRAADDGTDERTLRYGDRELELLLRAGERDRLDALLDDYPVFKIDAPATRKASEGEVYVAAVADPKHLADFIEDCCRKVYGLSESFVLRVA